MNAGLLGLPLLALLLLAVAGQEEAPGPYKYNEFMLSLTTSPQPFSSAYGHFHQVDAAALPLMAQVNAQVVLVSLGPCSAYAPHYQTDAGEMLYVRTGVLDVVMRPDGKTLARSLGKGDLMAIPPGVLHSYQNSNCDETEAIVLFNSAAPARIFPLDQLLGLPPQALIGSFGIGDWSKFKAAIARPVGHLYSLNDAECAARCNTTNAAAAESRETGENAGFEAAAEVVWDGSDGPSGSSEKAAGSEAAAAAEAGIEGNGMARSMADNATAAAATAAPGNGKRAAIRPPAARAVQPSGGPTERPLQQPTAASAPAPAPAATLAAGRGRRLAAGVTSGAASGAAAGGGAGGGGLAPGRQRRRLSGGSGSSTSWRYNSYMGSLLGVPPKSDSVYGVRHELTYKQLPGLHDSGMAAAWVQLHACSMSSPHFHPNADEFVTVLTGTVDVLLLVNGTSPRLVVRTMQPGDLVVIPRGITHYTAQSNCEDTSALVMWNSASVTRVYPVQGLMDLPEGVLIAAFGLKGGTEAYPDWQANIDVPTSLMASLNDPQCIILCEDPEAPEAAAAGKPR